jgi:hypothetical protein
VRLAGDVPASFVQATAQAIERDATLVLRRGRRRRRLFAFRAAAAVRPAVRRELSLGGSFLRRL